MYLDYDWLDDVDVRIRGGARDVVHRADGSVRVVDESSLTAETANGVLSELTVTPAAFDTGALLGHSPRQGFRRQARNAHDRERETLALLLDDLPAALVVAGYVLARERRADGTRPPSLSSGYVPQADLCAGWRADGTMMVTIRAGEELPFLPIPAVPNPFAFDGNWAVAAIPTPGLRRARRIDVAVDDDAWRVDAWFRDTYCAPDGECGAVHEYTVEAVVDPADHTVVEMRAEPHALPWYECPAAAEPVARLVGTAVETLRTEVPARLTGVECCTHLNNELRALADVAHMVAEI
jgi:hypothetical protein